MKAIADLCIIPIGVGVSLSDYIAAAEKILIDAGLNPKLHAYGSNVEGEFDVIMQALQACHEKIHAMGAPRVSTSMKIGTRIDRDQSMADKIKSVAEKLA